MSSKKKLKELIVYIASKTKDDEAFGETKLNKILFFADFFYYSNTGKSITGNEYVHLDHGPVPMGMKFILQEMENKDIGFAITQSGPFMQKRIVALREPNLDMFTPDMIAHLDEIINSMCLKRRIRATWLSRYSHDFMGWLVTQKRQVIPYQTIFLKNKENQKVSQREVDRAFELQRTFRGQYGLPS